MVRVKSIIVLYTLIDNKLNILLDNDSIIEIECSDTLDNENNKYLSNKGLKVDLKQCYTYSTKEKDNLYLNTLYVGIIPSSNIKDLTPSIQLNTKNEYINKSLEFVKERINKLSVIKNIYKEFSLPDLQRFYESIFNVRLDRRNFRKHLIKLDVIEPISRGKVVGKGRPATIYKFKDSKIDKILF